MTLLEQSLRMSPRDPGVARRYRSLALAHCYLKDYGQALTWAMRGVAAEPGAVIGYAYGAMIYVGLGDIAKAKQSFETMRRLAPEMAARWLRGDTVTAQHIHRERFLAFKRIAAGLEDPSAADPYR